MGGWFRSSSLSLSDNGGDVLTCRGADRKLEEAEKEEGLVVRRAMMLFVCGVRSPPRDRSFCCRSKALPERGGERAREESGGKTPPSGICCVCVVLCDLAGAKKKSRTTSR